MVSLKYKFVNDDATVEDDYEKTLVTNGDSLTVDLISFTLDRDETAGWKAFLLVLVEGFFGWSPPGWFSWSDSIKFDGFNWLLSIPIILFFAVDILDAAVDFIIAFHEMTTPGGEATDKLCAILLTLATAFCGIISAYHAVRTADFTGKTAGKHEVQFETGYYILMELTIFMVEDGASILYLAKNPGDHWLYTFSAYLNLICGVCFIVAAFWNLVVSGQRWQFITLGILALFPPIYFVCILIIEVIVNNNDTTSTPGNFPLFVFSVIIYAIGSIGILAFFFSFRSQIEISTTVPTSLEQKKEL